MNGNRVVYRLCPIVVLGVFLFSVPSALFAQPGNVSAHVFPPNSEPFGLTYGEWGAKFWQWAFSLPATHHPSFDTTDCSTGQSGPVWFLSAKFCATVGPVVSPDCQAYAVVRSCQIPAGKALLYAMAYEDSFLEEPVGATEATLRSNAKSLADQAANVRFTVDGREVESVRICSTGSACSPLQSPLFSYTLAPDNVLAATGEYLHADQAPGLIPDGASSQGVNDGFFVLLAPLPVGRHTLVAHNTVPAYGLTFEVTYHLNVVPRVYGGD